MTETITNLTGKAINQKIMARCDCGSIDTYRLATFRASIIKRCQTCNKKILKSGALNINRQRKLKVIELEKQLQILSEKLKEYKQKTAPINTINEYKDIE